MALTDYDMSDYQDIMRFPILFVNASDDITTNGLGPLPDLINGVTHNTIDQADTIQFEYKIDGINANKIDTDEVVVADSNWQKTHQRFRITRVTPSLANGSLEVEGVAIGPDFLNKNPIRKQLQFPSASPNAAWQLIQDNLEYPIPQLSFDSDVSSVAQVNFPAATNAINLVLDPDQEGDTQVQSIKALFGGHIDFDNFQIHHRQQLGVRRERPIRYGFDVTSAVQEKYVEEAYTGCFFHAEYKPGQPQANVTNVDWANFQINWQSIGTVTYAIKGNVDIYDAPVEGHHKIGELIRGQKIKVGNPLEDGAMVPAIKNPQTQLQVSTVNGDTWYPLEGGGWIDGQWITFDKSGDYLVSDVQGHGHVDVNATNLPGTKFPVHGTAVVTYVGNGDKIHIYKSPFQGPDHVRLTDSKGKTRTLKNGQTVKILQEAIDENGHSWYRIGPHEWLYGPHLSISKSNAMASYPTNGVGYVKKNAQKYIVKKGKVVPAPKTVRVVSSKGKKTKPYTWVKRKINGKEKRVKRYNKAYLTGKKKKLKTTVNSGYAKIHGQTVMGGTTYYNVGSGVLVKSSDMDWKKRRAVKPKTPQQINKQSAISNGKIEIYAEPRKNSAINWAVDTKVGLDIQSQAKSGDGETWDYVTYAGKSGWIMDKYINYEADEDFEPTTIQDTSGQDDGADLMSTVDQQEVRVELPEGTIIADSCIGKESQRILDVDLSSYIQHNDEDLSGQQPDGSFKATDDDISQLRDAANKYMEEHRIGEVTVSFTIEAVELRKMNGEIEHYGIGDIVPVDFSKIGMTAEAPLTAGDWNWITHEWNNVQIGNPPKTWEHLLLEQTQKQNDSLRRTTNGAVKNAVSLTARIHNALLHEGSDRISGEKKIAEELGMVNKAHDRLKGDVSGLAVSIKSIDKAMQGYDTQMQQAKDWIMSGGSNILQFVDAEGKQTYVNPTEIRALTGNGGWMIFNSNGLLFTDSTSANAQTVTSIDSRGWINAEYINAGQIKSLNASELTVSGHFKSEVGGYMMTMGEYNPNAAASVQYSVDTSRGLSVGTPGFGAVLGSGSLTIGGDNNHYARYGPSYLSLSGEAGSCTIQTNSSNAGLDLVLGSNEWIMKQGAISIKAASGNWHRVLTSGNIGKYCYVNVGGKSYPVNVGSIPPLGS